MWHQSFGTLLLRAAGGSAYYEQLWGPGLTQANKIINSGTWAGRVFPNIVVTQKMVHMHLDMRPFGSYCHCEIPTELMTGKWQSSDEKGIWVGCSGDVKHDHLVVPIEWDSTSSVLSSMPNCYSYISDCL